MKFERNIRLEKFLEALVEQYMFDLGEEVARECPVLRSMSECLAAVKPSNNAEIRVEIGIVRSMKKCPCWRRQ